MINTETSQSIHTTVADQAAYYPIGFKYDVSPDTGAPELLVTLDDSVLTYGTDYTVGVSGLQLVNEPEAGKTLTIKRDVAFTQEIDLQTGFISPDQIEDGFDRAVMRDQELRDSIDSLDDDIADLQGDVADLQAADIVLQNNIDAKQDIIVDLATIRSGAAAGATAVQPSDLATVATSGSYNDLSDKPKYAASIRLTIDPSTFVVTAQLKDQDNNNLGTAQTIDLPLESVVVSGAYDSDTREVVLTLEGGSTVRFSVADLVSGLQTEITAQNMLDADLVDDSASANKFVTSTEKTAISTAVQPADLAGYVAKSGDTMTGTLDIKVNSTGLNPVPSLNISSTAGPTSVGLSTNGYGALRIDGMIQTNNIEPLGNNYRDLGSAVTKWKTAYTTKLNNGADLAVPTSGGTLARLEDVPDVLHMVTDNTAQSISAVKTFTAANPDSTTAQTIVANYAVKFGTSGNNDLFAISANTNTSTLSIVGDNASNIIDIAASGAVLNHFQVTSSDVTFGGNSLINPGVMTGADGTNAGTSGLVPAPAATDDDKFLCGDGTWKAAGGGLPDQTGQSGKFLTTDGTDASWSDKPLVNTATGANSLTIFGTASTAADTINIGRNSTTNNKTYAVAIGNNAKANDYNAVAIGRDSEASYVSSIAIGNSARVWGSGVGVAIGQEAGNYPNPTAKCCTCIGAYAKVSAPYAIQINASDTTQTNSEQGTLAVALRHNNTGVNYKLLDSDGTVPTARLTKVNTTVTLAAANWAGGSQTVSVTGMTATGVVFVNPDPSDQADYTSAGILCTAQAAGTLTFTCDTTPSNDIDVVVVMM